MSRVPVLEKASLHGAEVNDMLAEPAQGLSPVTTSGSTGQPTRVYRSARDQAEVSAPWARVLHAFGHGFFASQVNVNTGRAVARDGPVVMLRSLGVLPEIRHISSFEPMERQIELLRRHRPHTFTETVRLLVVPSRTWRPDVVEEIQRELTGRFGPGFASRWSR